MYSIRQFTIEVDETPLRITHTFERVTYTDEDGVTTESAEGSITKIEVQTPLGFVDIDCLPERWTDPIMSYCEEELTEHLDYIERTDSEARDYERESAPPAPYIGRIYR